VPPTTPASRRRPLSIPALATLLLFSGCATRSPRAPHADFRQPPTLAAPARPAGVDALPRWRADFDRINAQVSRLEGEDPLVAYESADARLPAIPDDEAKQALALVERFTLGPDETIVLPPIHGPETPFPDHQSLRQIATLRGVLARRALAAGDLPLALRLVRQNLAQARATLRAQEGIIPLIHATGVWQCALDGAHALARSPRLPAAEARALLQELQTDAELLPRSVSRAFVGEYLHVYRVIVDRLPQTDDPELLLSAVASLGMAEPEAVQPGEIGLGLTRHTLLDRDATLAAYEADLGEYLDALAASSRFPRGIYELATGPTLAGYRRQLGAFYDYTSGEVPDSLELTIRARAAMESTPNPVGKLLAVYLTPPWEVLMASAFRREAQRAAVCGLLAWRIHGRPADWNALVAAGILPGAPADPFSDAPLRLSLDDTPRIWSVYLNGKDDGGQPIEGNTGQPEDLVWIW